MHIDPTPFLQYGAMGLCVLLLFGIGYGLRFLALEILKPIRDSIVSHISDIPAIKTTLVQIHSNTEHLMDRLDTHGERLDAIQDKLGMGE